MNHQMVDNILQNEVEHADDPFVGLGERREDIQQREELTFDLPIVAACRFNGDATGTNAPEFGRGIRHVVREGTGDYTVVFNQPLRTDRYLVLITPTEERVCWVDTQSRESFGITTEDNASSAADTNELFIAVILP